MIEYPFNGMTAKKSVYALVVSSLKETASCIEKYLAQAGISTVVAETEKEALKSLLDEKLSYIFVDTNIHEGSCHELIRSLRVNIVDQYIPIIILATTEDDEKLSYCISAGCDDVLFKPFTSVALNARISSLEQIRELKQLYKGSINEQIVAKRILTNAIDERSIQFEEIGLLSRSKAVFSGDLFLTARHPDGSLNILLADFTGHGLSAAIGALPVADIFSAMTKKGFDLSYILENINTKLHTLLPTSMFMACSVLNIARDLKYVNIWSGGMPEIYIRDCESGRIKHKVKSSHIPLGITDENINHYDLETFDLTPGDLLILYTDGLTEALNNEDDMFGQQRLEDCLQQYGEEKAIFMKLVNTFNEFCGGINPMDDVTVACIPCTTRLMCVDNIDTSNNMRIARSLDNNWCWYMELGGSSLHEINPVPIVIEEIHKIYGRSVNADKLSNIMSLLYENVIGHGEYEKYSYDINKVNASEIINSDIYIKIGIKKVDHNGMPALLVHMEDSGKEIAKRIIKRSLDNAKDHVVGPEEIDLPLIYELNKTSSNTGAGNSLEAIICAKV